MGVSTPPSGPVNSHTRDWIRYRREVREAAGRWCDRPVGEHQHEPDGPCNPLCTDTSCGECEPCRATQLIKEGRA